MRDTTVQSIKVKYTSLEPVLDERARRLWAAAEALGSVDTSASSRHCPDGSRTRTTITGSVLLPLYQSTSRITCTRSSFAPFGKSIVTSSAG